MYEYRKAITNYPSRIVEHNFGGYKLSVHLCDPIAERWYDKDWFPHEIDFIATHLSPGAVVWNIGSHQAVLAMMLARMVGPTGRVLAVEAHPHNARVAERNRELNHLTWLAIEHVAVSSTEGEVQINELLNSTIDSTGQFGTLRVPATTLDNLKTKFPLPQLVVLDIEGYECAALKGGASVLDHGPTWCIEVHSGVGLEAAGGSVSELIGFFRDRPYELWMSSGSEPDMHSPMFKFDPDSEIVRSRFFLFAVPQNLK